MATSGKGYLNNNFDPIINIVFAIIPFTSWILGAITRIQRGQTIPGILQLIPPITLVFWILDIVTVVTEGDLKYWA